MNEHNTFKNPVRRVWSRFSSRFSARFCAWFFLSLHLRKILLGPVYMEVGDPR